MCHWKAPLILSEVEGSGPSLGCAPMLERALSRRGRSVRCHLIRCGLDFAARKGCTAALRQQPRSLAMPPDAPPMTAPPVERQTYDDALGRRIVELHVWAVQEGLRGVAASDLFDGFCQRLVTVGVPLWRGFVGTQTLHPQWRGDRHFLRAGPQSISPPTV